MKSPHRQAEAFHRMKYQCNDRNCGAVEWVWNSRDGVTPFGILMRCGHDGYHVDWRRDQYMPGYIPAVDERVFVTLTIEKAREYRRADVEAHWDKGDYPMRDAFESKEAAVEKLAEHDVASFAPDTPDLIVVTPELHEMFRTREVAR